MARAITADEHIKLRGDSQYSRLYLAIPNPATVMKASVTAVPTEVNNSVHEVAISVLSGSASNVIADQTVMVTDSTEATIKGYCRVRKAPTTTALYVGEISGGEISWVIGDRVHVLNDFQIWPKHIRIVDETTFYMDWDIAYSDQHANPDPIVNMGPDAVAWLTGASVQVNFDFSGSSVISGSIASYSLAVSPTAGTTISNGTTATPHIVFTAPGIYRVACTITTAAGKSYTGYRFVYIYSPASPPTTEFQIGSQPTGSIDAGGWSFSVTLYDQATLALVRDRAKVILFADDWYQGVAGSLGPIAGRENVVVIGWIAGESIDFNPDGKSVTFDVRGPHYWLSICDGFPVGLEDTDFADNGGGNPNRWTEMNDLTTDKALWHFCHWRSTLTRFADVYLPGDAKQAATIKAPNSKLWGQLITMAEGTILARSACDRYGRLFIKTEQNYLPIADRGAVPVVMDITTDDRAQLTMTRRVVPRYSQVEASGVYYLNKSFAPMGARSPGDVPARLGQEVGQYSELVMGTQAQALELAGLIAGSGAGQIESADLVLAANNRFIDIAPHMYLRTTIASGDSPRGITLTNARLIPRSVALNYNRDSGGWLVTVELEGEGVQLGAVAMTFPNESEPNPGGGGGEPPPPPPPPGQPPPPPVIGDVVAAIGAIASDVRTTENLNATSPTWTTEY
jgi:hypothetical protein